MIDSQKLRDLAGNVRQFGSLVAISRDLGAILGKFVDFIKPADCITGAPYFIFDLSRVNDEYRLQYLSYRYESEGIDLTESYNRFKGTGVNLSHGLIGYDTEYETDEANETDEPDETDETDESCDDKHVMLSHQLAFMVNGIRFGVVISTSLRFSDSLFLQILADIVQRLTGFSVKKWYLFAHFSVIEASWLDDRKEKQIRFRGVNSWKNERYRINRCQIDNDKDKDKAKKKEKEKRGSGKQWIGKTVLLQKMEMYGKRGRKLENEKITRVWVHFCDTKNLYPGSLDKAAAGLEFKKGDPKGDISKMSKIKTEQFEDFCRYGIRDAFLCTCIPFDIHSRFAALGLPFKPRTASFSEAYFKGFYEEHYAEYGDWRKLMGQVKGYHEGSLGKSWGPGKIQRRVLDTWYHGGRNEVHRVGCFGEAFYHDLKSAYPTAVIMMHRDYNYGRATHYWGSEAEREITKLRKHGPFQPHGVTVYCRFKDDAVPMFPTKVDGAVIFPRIFHGAVSWPEFWTALNLDMLEECTVIGITVFEVLPGCKLPDEIARLLKMRRKDKLLYKNLLNYQYGKTVQGLGGKVPFSSVSCPALGAYMTGFCRASVGELANLNPDYYGITTDGFISPHRRLNMGDLNKQVADKLATLRYQWIELEGHGTQSFFIKTRGYALWNGLKVKMKYNDEGSLIVSDDSKAAKLSRMGLQSKSVQQFINDLNAGVSEKSSFPGFSNLKPGQISTIEKKKFMVNLTFDMKHMIKADTMRETTFTINDVTLSLLSFDTRPLKDIYEYEALRHLAQIKNAAKGKKKVDYDNHEELEKLGLSESEISDLLNTYAMREATGRRLLWEFRKRIAHKVTRENSTWTVKQLKGIRRVPCYPVDLGKNSLESYDWILSNELRRRVPDADLRRKLKKKIIEEMEALQVKAA